MTARRFARSLAAAALLAALLAGCGSSQRTAEVRASIAAPSGAPTPSPVSATPSPSGAWGPLAVIPPQDGADTARTEGTLRITNACVILDTAGGPVLLLWPADRTAWAAASHTISFANFDGTTVVVGDGMALALGGGGDSSAEGAAPEAWLAETPWVARPALSCPLGVRWTVGAVMRPG